MNGRRSLLFSADQGAGWREAAPFIWSPTDDNASDDPASSILATLWDQPRWLDPRYLYDEHGSALFEQICELPEYYLTRTENSILERVASAVITAAPVECLVELGAGSAKKTRHLLEAQRRLRGAGIFAPIDVSTPGLEQSRDFVRRNFPEIDFHGLHASYEQGLRSIPPELPTLFVFLGSTVGNFSPAAFGRFFRLLSSVMGPADFLLLGADRVKDPDVLERAYDDSRGLTAEFILNVFDHINRLTGGNFDRARMRYYSRYNPEWQQIEMYAVSTASQEIRFPPFHRSFRWSKGERILVEISRKFDPDRLQQQLGFFKLEPVDHYTDPDRRFSLLLFRKAR